MSIYSSNRIGSVSTSRTIANESYGMNDIGRIMYESECNNQKIFEAVLATDFSEICAIKEGTLLESEVDSANKKSKDSLISKLKARLMAFWAKIKAAFEDVIHRIAAFIMKNGKEFAEKFRKNMSTIRNNYKNDYEAVMPTGFEVQIPTADDLIKEIRNPAYDTKDGCGEIVKKLLGKSLGASSYSPKEYQTEVIKKAFSDSKRKVSYSEFNGMLDSIDKSSDVIKGLQDKKKETQKAVDEYARMLKSLSNDNKTEIKDITTMVSACEMYLANTTKAAITVATKTVKSYRSTLAYIYASCVGKKSNAALGEAAAVEAEDDVDATFDSDEAPELDAKTQEDVDAVVAAAE